jgi:hypothetical protein
MLYIRVLIGLRDYVGIRQVPSRNVPSGGQIVGNAFADMLPINTRCGRGGGLGAEAWEGGSGPFEILHAGTRVAIRYFEA